MNTFVSRSLDDLQADWDADKNINQRDLGNETDKTYQLHSKYYKFFIVERMVKARLEADFKKLKNRKREFFIDGPTKATNELGWKLPPKGKVSIKSEAERYVDCDDDVIEAALLLGLQENKVEFLESIISNLKFRNNAIASAIDWQKFITGAK